MARTIISEYLNGQWAVAGDYSSRVAINAGSATNPDDIYGPLLLAGAVIRHISAPQMARIPDLTVRTP